VTALARALYLRWRQARQGDWHAYRRRRSRPHHRSTHHLPMMRPMWSTRVRCNCPGWSSIARSAPTQRD